MALPYLQDIPLPYISDKKVFILNHVSHGSNPVAFPQCHSNLPATLIREQAGRHSSKEAILLCAGQTANISLPAACLPSCQSFPLLHCDADSLSPARLAAPQVTLAGAEPPRMSDDAVLLQTVADGSHSRYARNHLRGTEMSQKWRAHPTE